MIWGSVIKQRFPRYAPCRLPWKREDVLGRKLLHENHDTNAHGCHCVLSSQVHYKYFFTILFFFKVGELRNMKRSDVYFVILIYKKRTKRRKPAKHVC